MGRRRPPSPRDCRVFAGGAQVFVLAPTTVLAKQHAATIAARFRPFGAGVELLLRVKESERKEVMAQVAAADAGDRGTPPTEPCPRCTRLKMLVIDEEQRFEINAEDQISA